MINPNQLLVGVIRPTLILLQSGLGTASQENAEEILLGTGMQESHLGDYIAQRGGPALGVWQMEPATANDIWINYLAFRSPTMQAVSRLMVQGQDRVAQLQGNLYYACAMARLRYARAPGALPAAGDLEGQAAYYVKNYNAGGAATVEEYIDNWHALQAVMARG